MKILRQELGLCSVKRTFVRFGGYIFVFMSLLDTVDVVDSVAAGRRQSRRCRDSSGTGCHAAVKHWIRHHVV